MPAPDPFQRQDLEANVPPEEISPNPESRILNPESGIPNPSSSSQLRAPSPESGIRDPGSLYTHILWDWNGTLLDDSAFSAEILNGLLADRNLPAQDPESMRRLFDFPVRGFYEKIGFDFEAEPFEVVSTHFVHQYNAGIQSRGRLVPGALPLLRRLRASGFTQSVLSAAPQETLDQLVVHFGLGDLLPERVGIDSIHAPGKTAQGIRWLEESGLNPASVLLVGDTRHDFEVAQSMGCACLLVDYGHQHRDRFLDLDVPLASSLEEVQQHILDAG